MIIRKPFILEFILKKQNKPAKSFTSKYETIKLVLHTDCWVAPITAPQKKMAKYLAIWDTGATQSVISQKVVDDLKLKPIGVTYVHGIGGVQESYQYIVGLKLPNEVFYSQVIVTVGKFVDFQILIGMNIISTGSFAVTNRAGKTVMSFSFPSHDTIDFVKQYPVHK